MPSKYQSVTQIKNNFIKKKSNTNKNKNIE